ARVRRGGTALLVKTRAVSLVGPEGLARLFSRNRSILCPLCEHAPMHSFRIHLNRWMRWCNMPTKGQSRELTGETIPRYIAESESTTRFPSSVTSHKREMEPDHQRWLFTPLRAVGSACL